MQPLYLSRVAAPLLVFLVLAVGLPFTTKAQEQSPSMDAAAASGRAALGVDYHVALKAWKGDYDGMLERRLVRIAVPYSLTHYFLDGAVERGISAAMGRRLEQEINRQEGFSTRRLHVIFIPAPRTQLLSYLSAGLADIAMGNICIGESRSQAIDYSIPFIRNSRELVVSGPGAPDLASMEDLAGQQISVQTSRSYFQSLAKLDKTFAEQGLAPIAIDEVSETLEPDEILALVQAGFLPMTVIDRHLAEFWGRVFPNLAVHDNLVVAAERDIAWAFRKNSPLLKELVNEFLATHRHRTEFGNIILRRYLQNDTWALRTQTTADRERYEQTIPLFRKYGEEYDIDPLLLLALGYQESRLDQETRSRVGAIGVMQLLPRTGAAMQAGDITELEANIRAGARYFRSLIDLVENPEVDGLNTVFFALASYNAGQTRVRRLRREAEQKGLDPNVWLHNVELVAATEIGRETVQFVRNIYQYYRSFQRVEEKRQARERRLVN